MSSAPKSTDEDQLDLIFHALANRTRRAQLAMLAQGPVTISELAAPFDMTLPAASKHLKVLEKAGLVTREIDGRVHRCSLRPDPLQRLQAWTETWQHFWSGSLDALARFIEAESQGDDDV